MRLLGNDAAHVEQIDAADVNDLIGARASTQRISVLSPFHGNGANPDCEAMIKAAQDKAPGKLVLVVVDYLQIVESKESDPRSKVADVVAQIDEPLRAYRFVGILISQMSRNASRESKQVRVPCKCGHRAPAPKLPRPEPMRSRCIRPATAVELALGVSMPARPAGRSGNLRRCRRGTGQSLAEALGIFVSALLVVVAAYLLKRGADALGKTKFAQKVGETRLAKWLEDRQKMTTTKDPLAKEKAAKEKAAKEKAEQEKTEQEKAAKEKAEKGKGDKKPGFSKNNKSDIPDQGTISKVDGAPPVDCAKQGKHVPGHPNNTNSTKTRWAAGVDHVTETQNAYLKGSPVPGQPQARSFNTGRPVGENSETWVKVHISSAGEIHGVPLQR